MQCTDELTIACKPPFGSSSVNMLVLRLRLKGLSRSMLIGLWKRSHSPVLLAILPGTELIHDNFDAKYVEIVCLMLY